MLELLTSNFAHFPEHGCELLARLTDVHIVTGNLIVLWGVFTTNKETAMASIPDHWLGRLW